MKRFFSVSGRTVMLSFACLLLSGCAPGWNPAEIDQFADGGMGGDDPDSFGIMHLPFFAGEVHLCTQGVGGSYSHTGNSTYYGIDLDTGNSWDEEIFAPASGIARVHYDSSPNGFGYHINIDLGNGTYLVLAHLSDIFVADGDEVVAGQLIAFEGCTGNCTGDHVHIDLHEGDAALQAEYGTSILASYITRDVTTGGNVVTLSADQFVCDLYSGHFYESQLPTVLWHPDGTLLKYPACPDVYVIDQGELALFNDENVFWSYNFEFSDVVPMSEEEWLCYGESSVLLEASRQYRVVEDDEHVTWLAYETEDDPGRYRQRIENHVIDAVVESWGVPGILTLYQQEAAEILEHYPIATGQARLRDGTLVREDDSADIYVVHEGTALPIETWDVLVMLGFENRNIVSVPEDRLSEAVFAIGNCASGIGCITLKTVTTCGGDLDLTFPDDDPVIEDDDDTGDDDTGDDDTVGDDDDTAGDDDDTAPTTKQLEIIGRTNFVADYLWLSGELFNEYGSPANGGFNWASLEYQPSTDEIIYVATVESDWTFRYSFEYEINNVTNWSCVAPFPPGTLTMDLEAYVDSVPITITAIDNFLGGCELFVTVPP